MAILVKRDPKVYESAPAGTLTHGLLVDYDGTVVDAVADPVLGIVVDGIVTNGPPYLLRIAGTETVFEDTVMDGVAIGTLVWSDGDGTYSVTAPTVAAGAMKVIFGIVRKIDTQATDVGCEIEIVNQLVEDGTV